MSDIEKLRAAIYAEVAKDYTNEDFDSLDGYYTEADDLGSDSEGEKNSASHTGEQLDSAREHGDNTSLTGGAIRRKRSTSRRRSVSRGRGLTGGRKKSKKRSKRGAGITGGRRMRMRPAVMPKGRSRSRGRGYAGGRSIGQKILRYALRHGVPAAAKAARAYLAKGRGGMMGAPRVRSSRLGSNPWIEHVKAVWHSNPQLSYKQAMVVAKRSYMG